MKKRLSIACLCLLPLSAAAYLLYSLETYYRWVHNDSGFWVCAYCLFAFFISLVLWEKNKAAGKHVTCIFLVSVAILAGVYYVGTRIPFCVECDHVTAEELGFLKHWIKPIY